MNYRPALLAPRAVHLRIGFDGLTHAQRRPRALARPQLGTRSPRRLPRRRWSSRDQMPLLATTSLIRVGGILRVGG